MHRPWLSLLLAIGAGCTSTPKASVVDGGSEPVGPEAKSCIDKNPRVTDAGGDDGDTQLLADQCLLDHPGGIPAENDGPGDSAHSSCAPMRLLSRAAAACIVEATGDGGTLSDAYLAYLPRHHRIAWSVLVKTYDGGAETGGTGATVDAISGAVVERFRWKRTSF